MSNQNRVYGPVDWNPGLVTGILREKESNNHAPITDKEQNDWISRIDGCVERAVNRLSLLLNDGKSDR